MQSDEETIEPELPPGVVQPVLVAAEHIAVGDCVLHEGEWVIVEIFGRDTRPQRQRDYTLACKALISDVQHMVYVSEGEVLPAYPLWLRSQVVYMGRGDPVNLMAKLLREVKAKALLEAKANGDG
ncbi:MAG: hypothetical protein CL819_09060 [Croceicoccus sp.]|nr:hypothetical protein [Croceicoccus sp.]